MKTFSKLRTYSSVADGMDGGIPRHDDVLPEDCADEKRIESVEAL
jgi:hypothetical protein